MQFPRGSEWRIWDLHIHSPASFHWNGQRFSVDRDDNNRLIDTMITAMNDADASVFALMDYWTFDGWFKLTARLNEDSAPELKKQVFPGIELRLVSPTNRRLNAHVVFSNEVTNQSLKDFKSELKLALIDRPLSDEGLTAYAKQTNSDKLKKHGYNKADLNADDRLAYQAGCRISELTVESYKSALEKSPDGMALGFMPFDTTDGLSQVEWADHYAYALDLFHASPIFETRSVDTWAAFVGIETSGNKGWYPAFQEALGNVPRLAVSGSDAHRFLGVQGDNDKRGYGDFPSGKRTWIKADPTWQGLLQALKEPGKRSFVGERPEKLASIDAAKTFYIDKIEVTRLNGAKERSAWLHGTNLPINPELIAIIGNKGSGKSALADIIALLGNSQQSRYFSFLTRNRFRGKSGEPASSFRGKLNWLAGEPNEASLAENPLSSKVELVRYIPQNRFEDLCNEHVSGRSNAFEDELRSVIFSHLDNSIKAGALDFDQLIESQEQVFRHRLSEKHKSLSLVNSDISRLEVQLAPVAKRRLAELLALKERELTEHDGDQPPVPDEPTGELSEAQRAAQVALATLTEEKSSSRS